MRRKRTGDTNIIPDKGKGKRECPKMAKIVLRPAGAVGSKKGIVILMIGERGEANERR